MYLPADKHNNRHQLSRAFVCLALALCITGGAIAETAIDYYVEEKSPTVVKTGVRYAIDFQYLKEAAPDSVAWLYQPNTTINQPVMHSDNPKYYLQRQFDGRISSNGSIYMSEGMEDFSAASITIYGRNCADCTLFGSLSYYQEDEYYKKNPTLYLLTPQGDYQLDIFAGIRTKLNDNESWRVSQKSTSEFMHINLPKILEKSFIRPMNSMLPEEGDEWALLATASPQSSGSRYVLYARKRPIRYDTVKTEYVNQLEMDSRRSAIKRVSVKDVGDWVLYAQNDTTWNRLVFEAQTSRRRRPFGDGGCGPTAIATAIVNIVDKDALPGLRLYAGNPLGYRFCSCSVNEYHCNEAHLKYQLTTPDEYFRYLPLAVANFSTGNNKWGVMGRVDGYGTNMEYLDEICTVYGIVSEQTYDINEAVEFLKGEGTIAVACTGGYDSPFTSTSHFIVLAGVDEDYLYILDTLRRDSYKKWDERGWTEILTPGFVRIKLEDVGSCALRPIYMLRKEESRKLESEQSEAPQ